MKKNIFEFSDIIVTDKKNYSASSSSTFNAIDFDLRPRKSTQDMMQIVPGLFTAQHAGGGKAEQIFLRGFDADHGTDVNISIDGVPVNMVSHAHGQGYADLHFVIPETVQGLDVQKGPYFTGNGDFSTAGSVKFKTYDRLENNLLTLETGSFGSARGLTMFNLPINSNSTSSYLAVEFTKSNGYFDRNQKFNRLNIFGKVKQKIGERSNLIFSASGFGSHWNASGQVPERAIENGLINRFGSIDDSEGGNTKRYTFNLAYNNFFSDNTSFESQVYFFKYQFKLFSNFTFFLNDGINGDEVEQDDNRSTFGYKGSFNFNNKIGSVKLSSTIGAALRNDDIDLQLWNAANQYRINPKVIAGIKQTSLSGYFQEEFFFSPIFKLEAGIRLDHFIFNVNDKLNEDGSGKKSKTILSPKANFVFSPKEDLNFF